jgi:hypothetical protein
VSFEDVLLPLSALRGGFPTGDAVEYMERNLAAGLFHAAAAFGIAEVARATVAAGLARRDELDPHSQMIAAENFVDLSACRAVLSSAGALIDEHHERNPTSRGTAQELTELFAEAQSAKVFIGEAAVRIVDRALALSGGAGYLNGSPLARAYRDVRAMPFMHPLGANRAYAFLGQLAAAASRVSTDPRQRVLETWVRSGPGGERASSPLRCRLRVARRPGGELLERQVHDPLGVVPRLRTHRGQHRLDRQAALLGRRRVPGAQGTCRELRGRKRHDQVEIATRLHTDRGERRHLRR